MSQTDMSCTVCGAVRLRLRPRKSKLMPGTQMWLCNDCFDAKKEPRFIVILTGRTEGIAAVSEYLRHHRYNGEEIPASDFA